MANIDRRIFLARTAMASAAPSALSACLFKETTPPETSYRIAVQRVLSQFHIPGALASVRRPGDPEWKEAFGYADVATRTPIGTNRPDLNFAKEIFEALEDVVAQR